MTRNVWGNLFNRNSPDKAHIRLFACCATVALACLLSLSASVQAYEATPTTITLHWTATGDDGTIGRASMYDIRYSLNPISAANWGNATRCTGEPFPAVSGSAQSYTITGLSPSTTYYVRMKAADEAFNWSLLSNSATVVTTAATISPRMAAAPDSGAAPLQVSFSDLSTGNITSRQWLFGDGSGSTQTNPIHTYASPGSYTVRLTVTGPDGSASVIETDLIEVVDTAGAQPITADFSATPQSGPAPLQVSFSDQSIGTVTGWQWNFGDGVPSAQQNPIHEYSRPGTYTVTLTAGGPNGNDIEVKTGFITVTDTTTVSQVNADFDVSPTAGAAPLQVSFSDLSSGDVLGWEWDFGDGASSDEQNPSHTYSTPGNYDVELIVTGENNVDSYTQYGVIHVADTTQPALADFTAFPLTGAAPLLVDFVDQSLGSIVSWSWDFGDGGLSSDANPSHVFDTPGDYSIRLIVADTSDADTLVRSSYVSVSDTSSPAAKIVLPSDAVAVDGEADGPIDRIRSSDDLYLSLQETTTGGSPEEQFSYLHYVIGFNVPVAQRVVLRAEAHRPGNSYDENFAFQWSTNNVDYVTLATVTTPFDSMYSANIPIVGPARLYIRVTDNDRTPGHGDQDILNVDYVYLEVDGEPEAPDTILVTSVDVVQGGGVDEDFYALASVLVLDQLNNPMGGVIVDGVFDGPISSTVTGTTSVDGLVQLRSQRTGAPEGIWSFRVTDVSAPGLSYDPSLSLSLGNQVVVSGVPQSFVLSQNYPNPFNPSTSINLWLPTEAPTTVGVFDVTGRQVAVLHKGPLSPGHHVFTWDAASYASGIYFFKVDVGGKTATKKAALLK